MSWTFVGSEKISTTGTGAYTLTPPSSLGFIQRAVLEMVASSDANAVAYYTFDGTTPSSSNGRRMLLADERSDCTVVMGLSEMDGFSLVSSSAGLHVHVDYYG